MSNLPTHHFKTKPLLFKPTTTGAFKCRRPDKTHICCRSFWDRGCITLGEGWKGCRLSIWLTLRSVSFFKIALRVFPMAAKEYPILKQSWKPKQKAALRHFSPPTRTRRERGACVEVEGWLRRYQTFTIWNLKQYEWFESGLIRTFSFFFEINVYSCSDPPKNLDSSIGRYSASSISKASVASETCQTGSAKHRPLEGDISIGAGSFVSWKFIEAFDWKIFEVSFVWIKWDVNMLPSLLTIYKTLVVEVLTFYSKINMQDNSTSVYIEVHLF